MKPIPTIPCYWWLRSRAFMFYACGIAGLVCGAAVVRFAPEYVAILKEWL